MRYTFAIATILGALCSVVKPASAICSYDNIKKYYYDLEKDAIDSCHKDKSGKVCAAYARSKGIPAPVLVAVPESYNEVQRKKAICINNEKLHLWYKTKADIIRKSLDVQSLNEFIDKKQEELKKDSVVPAKEIKSNAELLEIKLRDIVVAKIRAEIKNNLDLPLNDADIDVLAFQICKKNHKTVTGSIVKLLLEESENLTKMCGILTGN